MEERKKTQELKIELKEDVAQGIYSNLAIVTHSNSEFVVDFVRIVPGMNKANVKSRIILTPDHAKRLISTLQDNVEKYEKTHGEIKTNFNIPSEFPLNFGGPTGKA